MEVGKVLHPVAKEKMKVDTRLWWSCWVLSFCYTKIPQTHQVWWHLSWCAPTLPAAISSELWPAYLACKLHISNETTPRKPTWQWKITIVDRRYIFKCLAFHCHASSPGCIVPNISKPTLVSLKHQKTEKILCKQIPCKTISENTFILVMGDLALSFTHHFMFCCEMIPFNLQPVLRSSSF